MEGGFRADGDEQVAAEPQESSRWAVIFLLACTGVGLVSSSYFLGNADGSVEERDAALCLLSALILVLGGLTFTLVMAMLGQQGEDNPKLVYKLLQL